jgi:hypothetical protein
VLKVERFAEFWETCKAEIRRLKKRKKSIKRPNKKAESVFRIRIQLGLSSGTGSGQAKFIHKKRKNEKIQGLKCWIFSLKGLDACSIRTLEALHGSLRLSRTDNKNVSPSLKNQIRFFLQLKLFPIICHQKPASDSGFTKKSRSGYGFNEYRSETQFSIAGYRPWTKELERHQTLKVVFS